MTEITYFFISNSSEIYFQNCSMENSLLKKSFFIFASSLNYMQISNFHLKNISMLNSSFISAKNLIFIEFLDFSFENNEFSDSIIFEVESKQQIYKNFMLLSNNLKNSSNLIKSEENRIDSLLEFNKFDFKKNFFEKSVIIVSLAAFNSLNISDLLFQSNFIKENIFYFECNSNSSKIFFTNMMLYQNNFPILNDLSPFMSTKQSFIMIKGSFQVSIKNCYFSYNFCLIGPCGFCFTSSEANSLVSIVSSSFSNNLAIYLHDSDVPSCILFALGSLCLILQDVMMINNSVNYLNSLNTIEAGNKGNPCIYSDYSESSLSIKNCTFIENSGYGDYGDSSCIFFKGAYLEILNSLFLKNYGPKNSRIFLFVFDCPAINLVNLSISESVGGIFTIYSKKEIIKIISKNLSIINNEASVFSFFFLLQKYDFIFEEIFFTNNICYNSGIFLTLKSVGENPENQKLLFINCLFRNNTSVAPLLSVMIEFYTIGSYGNFTNCEFDNNKATGENNYGGIVFSNSEISGMVTFLNCNFKNNSAYHGGIGYFLCGTLIIRNSYIQNNKVLSPRG